MSDEALIVASSLISESDACWLNYCPQLQEGYTPLHFAARGGHTYVERLLSIPGIDVNIKNMVSWSIENCINMWKGIHIIYPW